MQNKPFRCSMEILRIQLFPNLVKWTSGILKCIRMNVCPNGESGAQMTERVLKAFRGIAEKGRDAVIVTHGGVIAAIMDYLFPDEGKNRYDWQPGSAEGYAVDLKERNYHKIPQ